MAANNDLVTLVRRVVALPRYFCGFGLGSDPGRRGRLQIHGLDQPFNHSGVVGSSLIWVYLQTFGFCNNALGT